MRAVGAFAAGVAPRDEPREFPPPAADTLPAQGRCCRSPKRLAKIPTLVEMDAATAAIFAFFLLGDDQSSIWATAQSAARAAMSPRASGSIATGGACDSSKGEGGGCVDADA